MKAAITSLFFFIFLFSSPFTADCQNILEKIENEVNEYIIYTDSIQIVKAFVEDNIEKYKAKSTKYYFWFSSSKIHQTQGGFSGRLLNGAYISNYKSNNNIKEQGTFLHGLKHGEWKEWFSNGQLKTVYRWKKGALHGKQYEYDISGNLTGITIYRNGKMKKQRK
jgi:antitoxin component YwqK of YwqJK toxin-antitoxin module